MSAQSRLRTAIDDGLLDLSAGSVAVVRPDSTFDIGALAGCEVTISTSSYVDYAQWQGGGYAVSDQIPEADTIIVNVPRSKAQARSLVALAARSAKRVVVDGSKTDGIDSIFKACRKILGDLPSITKAHGRIFWFDATDALSDWIVGAPEKAAHGFYTTAGVFSDGAVDKGSALLADALPTKLPKRIADFGAGWGYLSKAVLEREGVESIDLVEAEKLSLDCARLNIADERAQYHWADATNFQSDAKYDAVVMNPPFHTGRNGDPSLGIAFIASAASLLKPQGTLWMVANRHLPYEAALSDKFVKVDELPGNGGFKLFKASRPKR